MVALGGLLIAVGFVIVLPRGAFPGSVGSRNVEMGGRMYRTPGYQPDNKSRRWRWGGVLLGLGLMALGGLCIELGS